MQQILSTWQAGDRQLLLKQILPEHTATCSVALSLCQPAPAPRAPDKAWAPQSARAFRQSAACHKRNRASAVSGWHTDATLLVLPKQTMPAQRPRHVVCQKLVLAICNCKSGSYINLSYPSTEQRLHRNPRGNLKLRTRLAMGAPAREDYYINSNLRTSRSRHPLACKCASAGQIA